MSMGETPVIRMLPLILLVDTIPGPWQKLLIGFFLKVRMQAFSAEPIIVLIVFLFVVLKSGYLGRISLSSGGKIWAAQKSSPQAGPTLLHQAATRSWRALRTESQ